MQVTQMIDLRDLGHYQNATLKVMHCNMPNESSHINVNITLGNQDYTETASAKFFCCDAPNIEAAVAESIVLWLRPRLAPHLKETQINGLATLVRAYVVAN